MSGTLASGSPANDCLNMHEEASLILTDVSRQHTADFGVE
jgi:hypothetical protein